VVICNLNEGSKKCITAWYGPGWLSTIMTRRWAEHQFQAETSELFLPHTTRPVQRPTQLQMLWVLVAVPRWVK